MLDCLETYFLTSIETENTQNCFNNMQMQDKRHLTETFIEFKSRFLADAIEGDILESE